MFSGWCVYHIESHETYFMLRASEAEVVVIVFIVVPGSAMRPTSLSAGPRKSSVSSCIYLLLVTTQANEKRDVVDNLSSIGHWVLKFKTKDGAMPCPATHPSQQTGPDGQDTCYLELPQVPPL